jgi:hypothetical protein
MYNTIKSKSVFIVLFFALLLNISHDLFIAHEMQTESSILKLGTTDSHHNLSKEISQLHEIFHFSAILSSFVSIDLPYALSSKLLFISAIFPSSIQQNTFKPPIA